jgi:hypothetical protein
MRFSIIAAFMLPLTALAAPTPPPSSQSQVDEVRERFIAAAVETNRGINATIALATAIPQQDIVDQAKKAEEKIVLALNAALKIKVAGLDKVPVAVNEYVDNPFARARTNNNWGQND